MVLTGCQENKSCSKVLNFLERLDDRIRGTHEEIRDELNDQGVVGMNRVDTEGGEGDPHQHSFLDVRFPGTPERDYSRLSKGEGGLVCSQPDALLQLQQVWPHEPTLQGCCEVSG